MKKNLIKSTLVVAFLTVAGLGGMKAFQNQANEENDLLMQNIEAMCSDGEGESGMTLARICSKKSGKIFCSYKRGNRKCALDVVWIPYNETVPSRPLCPDDDFDFIDD